MTWKLRILCSSSILVAAMAGSVASAQTAQPAGAQPDPAQEIVVTGIRSSLNKAEKIKATNPNVVDSIVPEDIGKLPDVTVGDALQRITGVQVNRNVDQVVGVNIRGLPNVETTLNGEEIFTTSGRTFDFQNLPAEVLSGLNVYKTSSADQIEGGIAGLVDVQMHRPLDFKGAQVAGSVSGAYGTVVDKTNPNVNLLVSDRWDTPVGEFGALANVSYKHEDYDYPIVWEDTPHNPEPTSQTGLAQPVFVPFMGSVTTLGAREYPEANVSFQFRPNDHVEFYTDALYTGYDARYGNVNFFSVTSDNHPLSNVTLAPGGCVTLTGGYGCQVQTATVGGPGSNPYTASSNQAFDEWEDDYHGDIGMKFNSGPWSINSEFSGTQSTFKQTREIVDMSLNDEVTTLNSNVNGHGVWSLSGPSPTVAGNYYLQNLNESWTNNHGNEFAWKTDVKYDFNSGFLSQIQAGVRYADRKAASSGVTGGDVGFCVPGPTPGSCNDGNVSALTAFGPSFFQLFKGGDGNPAQFLSESTNFLLDNARAVRAFYGAPLNGPSADPAATFSDDETTTALWAQIKYDFSSYGVPIDGQFGVRAVFTDRTLSGTNTANIPAVINTGTTAISVNGATIAPGGTITPASTTYTPYNTSSRDTDILPNISARIHFNKQLQMHLSIAQTVTRPDFAALNPALSITPPTVNRQGNGSEGNPDLQPTKATAYDATLEYYFPHNGSASIAAFYRTVTGYIEPETVTVPYSTSYCTANGIPTTGGIAGQCNAIINTSASSGAGHIEGVELAAQKFFDFLPGALSGLGAQLNYTWIDSSAPIPGQNGFPTTNGELTNVSKNNASAVLLYEKYGLSARLAATYRGAYIESYFPGNDTSPPQDVVKPTTYLDLGVNYDLTKRITLSASGANLLGEHYNSYSGTQLFPRDIRTVNQTFMFGVHFRLN